MTTLNQMLDNHFALIAEIHKAFGYTEDWRVIPLDDSREYLWYLQGDDSGGDVVYAPELADFPTGNFYSAEIFTYRHVSQRIYRAQDLVMVLVDTHTDGNMFLMVFSAEKELTECPDIEGWGV